MLKHIAVDVNLIVENLIQIKTGVTISAKVIIKNIMHEVLSEIPLIR